MQIAEFLPALHHLVKTTHQLCGFPVRPVGAEEDVIDSWLLTAVYSSLQLTCKAEIGYCLGSQFSLRDCGYTVQL